MRLKPAICHTKPAVHKMLHTELLSQVDVKVPTAHVKSQGDVKCSYLWKLRPSSISITHFIMFFLSGLLVVYAILLNTISYPGACLHSVSCLLHNNNGQSSFITLIEHQKQVVIIKHNVFWATISITNSPTDGILHPPEYDEGVDQKMTSTDTHLPHAFVNALQNESGTAVQVIAIRSIQHCITRHTFIVMYRKIHCIGVHQTHFLYLAHCSKQRNRYSQTPQRLCNRPCSRGGGVDDNNSSRRITVNKGSSSTFSSNELKDYCFQQWRASSWMEGHTLKDTLRGGKLQFTGYQTLENFKYTHINDYLI